MISQWAGPVVILKAAGTRISFAPARAISLPSSGETEVETDAEADFAELCIEDSNLTAGSQCIGLLEGLSSFDVDIKEMHLPVLCNLAAAAVEDIGGVVNVPIF